MATAVLRHCATPSCPEKVTRGHCAKHKRQRDRARGTRHERGYTNKWGAYSKARLARHPWCVGYPSGQHKPFTILADVTDHILSARAHPELFWDETNHQSLCLDCNRRKAIAEEGGFGR